MKPIERQAMYAVISVGVVFMVDACATASGKLSTSSGDDGSGGWGTGGQTEVTGSSTGGSGAGNGAGGNGACKSSGDCPDPAMPCVIVTCNGGMCGTMNEAANVPCGMGTKCDGQGNCIGCMTGADCPGQEDDCNTRTCMNGTCGIAYSAMGTPCNQTGTCDGAGSCTLANGALCVANGDCLSALCVDGVCCESACTGTCMACNVPGFMGTCSNVSFGQDDGMCTGTNQSCDGAGVCKKDVGQSCSSDSECLQTLCENGKCVPRSCSGLPATCGPLDNENCCTSPLVPGGTFKRSNDPGYVATLSDFRLDRFEVTVGRFRKFVEAYPTSKPAAGVGAHPLIADSGWKSAWDANVAADQAGLKAKLKCNPMFATWTDMVGPNEHLPMNCVSWYHAFAFCAWDGGRLPTEAEWNYAAAGGSEQREYPWSNPPNSTTIDGTYAVWSCLGDGSLPTACAFTDILKVGSRSPKGDGKWGQADLSGNMWEWNLDWRVVPYSNPCNDCANLVPGSVRTVRGGGWSNNDSFLHRSSYRSFGTPNLQGDHDGFRCARTP